jgi:hypothetical protein
VTASDPQQWQRPAAHGYSPNPPNNDWGQHPPVVSGPTWPQRVAPPQIEPPPPAKRNVLPWVVAAVALLVAVGALAFAFLRGGGSAPDAASTTQPAAPVPDPTPFEATRDTCDPEFKGTTIGDRGKTFIIDGLGTEAIGCVLNALGAPESVQQQVWTTRALDGRQSATWSGFSASWTYHPDNGADIIITATS